MTTYSEIGDAIQAVADALAAAAADPGDAVRMLVQLVAEIGTPSGDAATIATAARFRRAALSALAGAAADYQPSSLDDALALMGQVVALLDAEITLAGDAGEDAVFLAFDALRSAVVTDLTTRGASLAPLIQISLGASLPAPVVAQLLYADGSREDELIARVDPVHPGFMPHDFQALSE